MNHPRIRTMCRMAAAWAVAACLLSCARSPESPADSEVVVATVDGAPITLKDLKSEIARIRGVTPSLPARGGTRTEVAHALRRLVERTVVVKEGERLGISVSGDEVEEEVRRYRADFPPGGLEKALLQEGIDADEWREGLRRSILFRKSSEAIAVPLADVSDQEVQKEFRERFAKARRPERVRVRQLLFDSREAAAGAREKIAEGTPPDEVAKRFSAGEEAPLDVDLGFLTREEMPAEVAAELFRLPEGGVSRVIRREHTYSIFLLVQKSPSGPFSYEEKAPEIRNGLLDQRREAAFRTWLADRVGAADISIREGILEQLAEGGK